jgi:hypothetical protein
MKNKKGIIEISVEAIDIKIDESRHYVKDLKIMKEIVDDYNDNNIKKVSVFGLENKRIDEDMNWNLFFEENKQQIEKLVQFACLVIAKKVIQPKIKKNGLKTNIKYSDFIINTYIEVYPPLCVNRIPDDMLWVTQKRFPHNIFHSNAVKQVLNDLDNDDFLLNNISVYVTENDLN